MRCDAAREAISSRLDDAALSVARGQLDAHLADCASCRRWQELAHVVTRRTRLGGALPPAGLAEQIVAGVRADVRRRKARKYWLAVARAVIGAGLLQLLATVPLLVMARGRTSGGGRVHVLGLVELTIGAGFFVGALVVLWRERDQSLVEAVEPTRITSRAARANRRDVSEVA